MTFDPTQPMEGAPLDAAVVRNQLNSLKALIDAQQSQLAAWQMQFGTLVPVLNRDAGGHWTLTYAGPAQTLWQVWARYPGSEAWSDYGEMQTSSFPALDGDIVPGGAAWWQIKLCGEGDFNCQTTPFSNIISFGPVPA
jgi:hypothetical protein